jgi:argininosuccinate lyase
MLAIVPLVSGWMREVQLDYERMRSAAECGFMNAWAAATYLVRRGVPFRLAHEIVGKVVHYCLDSGCELADVPLEKLRQFSPSFDGDFYSCLPLDSVLAIHDVTGGTAPARVGEALQTAKRKISALRGLAHAHA